MEAVTTRVASPEFVGRRQELASLADAVMRGTGGDAAVVLVGGDAGIGKTRLVAEVAGAAGKRGALLLEGGCVSLGNGEGLPFAPIVEALRRLPEMIAAGQVGSISDVDELRSSEISDVDAWREALGASGHGGGLAWRRAYTRYRLAEALLATRAPRREAAAALGDAFSGASALGATPLSSWIEGLARRSRIDIPAVETTAGQPPPAPPPAGDHRLTAREREVLSLLVEGHTNRRIAEQLFISESTAGVHVSNILGKLGVTSRTEAATVAARLGLVE